MKMPEDVRSKRSAGNFVLAVPDVFKSDSLSIESAVKPVTTADKLLTTAVKPGTTAVKPATTAVKLVTTADILKAVAENNENLSTDELPKQIKPYTYYQGKFDLKILYLLRLE